MRDVGRREPLERAAGAALGRTLSIRRLDVCSDESVAECLRGLPGGPDVLGEAGGRRGRQLGGPGLRCRERRPREAAVVQGGGGHL